MPYKLPPLTDEFISQMIFCMEDQETTYYLNVDSGELVESRMDAKALYLALPPWRPSDGYRTMEKFVSKLRNPIYRERLKAVLQSGKGVFRQFKDVLAEQVTLERLWYYFKEREIRKLILQWYEINDEAFRLESLGEEAPEEHPAHLILEDFSFTNDASTYKEELDSLYNEAKEELLSSNEYSLDDLKEVREDDRFLIALTLSAEAVGFVRYRTEGEITKILFYAIEKEFRGMGLFHALFDTLIENLETDEIIIPLMGDSLKIERMFEGANPVPINKTILLSTNTWREASQLTNIDKRV